MKLFKIENSEFVELTLEEYKTKYENKINILRKYIKEINLKYYKKSLEFKVVENMYNNVLEQNKGLKFKNVKINEYKNIINIKSDDILRLFNENIDIKERLNIKNNTIEMYKNENIKIKEKMQKDYDNLYREYLKIEIELLNLKDKRLNNIEDLKVKLNISDEYLNECLKELKKFEW